MVPSVILLLLFGIPLNPVALLLSFGGSPPAVVKVEAPAVNGGKKVKVPLVNGGSVTPPKRPTLEELEAGA